MEIFNLKKLSELEVKRYSNICTGPENSRSLGSRFKDNCT